MHTHDHQDSLTFQMELPLWSSEVGQLESFLSAIRPRSAAAALNALQSEFPDVALALKLKACASYT